MRCLIPPAALGKLRCVGPRARHSAGDDVGRAPAGEVWAPDGGRRGPGSWKAEARRKARRPASARSHQGCWRPGRTPVGERDVQRSMPWTEAWDGRASLQGKSAGGKPNGPLKGGFLFYVSSGGHKSVAAAKNPMAAQHEENPSSQAVQQLGPSFPGRGQPQVAWTLPADASVR